MDLGQMFLVGFYGVSVDSSHWLEKAITRDKLGGILLFDRNIDGGIQNIVSGDQLKRLVRQCNKRADTSLFVAIDQEGGRVCRLKEGNGFLSSRSAGMLAQKGEEAVVGESRAMAAQLRQLGINVNFAPVVDVNLNPDNPIIGRYERSYGADVDQIVALASAFVTGHHEKGIACCLKHFPGHGSSRGDSHLGFVDVSECWQTLELEPFKQMLATGYCDGIMTAHLVNRQLDSSGYPATLSPQIIGKLLRKDLGFSGVIFSDDLQMRAIVDGWSYKEAVQRAVLAGVDVLVVGNNLRTQPEAVQEGIQAIEELLDSGQIDENYIGDALERIYQLKQRIRGSLPWKEDNQHTT